MRVLVLGGTRFIGRAMTASLLSGGHDVTLFNRGLTGAGAFPEAHHIAGDRRSSALAGLGRGEWDCVLDISAYHPDDVRASVRVLGDRVAHFVFVSTVSVYAEPLPHGAGEDAPLLDVDASIADGDERAYGGRKALCERALRSSLGGRLAIVRPTIVIGPHDYTDRFTWWVRRLAGGGRFPAPARLGQPIQLIDARDLADFTVALIERRVTGIFNAVGPAEPLTLRGMIEAIQTGLGRRPRPLPVAAQAASDDEVPLTLPADGSGDGWFQISGAAARAHGLRLRSLFASAADVRDWDRDRGLPPLRVGPRPFRRSSPATRTPTETRR